MDVAVVRSLNDIEARLDCLNSPSFLSRFFSFPGIEIAAQSQTFWAWSALVLAFIAALTKIYAALNVLIIAKRSPQSQPLLINLGDEDDFSDDEAEETTSASASEDDKGDDDDEPTPSSRHRQPVYEGHSGRVAGFWDRCVDQVQIRNFDLHPQWLLTSSWTWSDFAAGTNVVNLWGDRDVSRPFLAGWSQTPGATVPSSSVLLAAVSDDSRNLSLRVWDRRIGRRTPAICAEWMARPGKFSVGDEYSNVLTVGDLRNVRSPVAKMTEAGEKSAWGANAVVVTNDAVGDGAVNGCGPSIATRLHELVWRYLL